MKPTAPIVCPVCNSPVDVAPAIHCTVCEYRSTDAPEYLWTFVVGILCTFLGFALGVASLLTEERPVTHWRGLFAGWFPLAPWPDSYHWLGFLIVGIVLTLGGVGLTRRRRGAWLLLVGIALYEGGLAGGAILGWWGNPTALWVPGGTALGALISVALLGRVGLALHRLPQRNAIELQKHAVENEHEARGGGTV